MSAGSRGRVVRRAGATPQDKPDFGPPTVIRFRPLFDKHAKSAKAAHDGVSARTSVYVHGIGNHPEEQVLVVRWDRALFGKDMGDRTRMAYWVNRARYAQPESCECMDPKCACHDPDEPTRTRRVKATGTPEPELELEVAVHEITSIPSEQDFLRSIGLQMIERARAEAAVPTGYGTKGTYGLRTKGVGDALLRRLTDLITAMALPDVQDFLFDPGHREQMENTFLARLQSGGGPFVVIAHSQGSMIAYDVLRQLKKTDVDIRLFVTIGSPLGLPPVRSVFKKWTGQKRLPFPPCVTRWLNVAAEGDVVALDEDLGDDIASGGARDFKNHIIRRKERDGNRLFDGNAHSSMGYLSTKLVQETVRDTVGPEFARSLGMQVITSDLVERLEAEPDGQPHKILIEVAGTVGQAHLSIEEGRRRIEARLRQLAGKSADSLERLDVQHHARYVSARLNRLQVEVLRTEYEDLQVHKVWKNATKRALICRSSHMVQAAPARQAYGAQGHNIEWAVLDTGIQHEHPHFQLHETVASIWDCTHPTRNESGLAVPRGGFVQRTERGVQWPAEATDMVDLFGHGTHVAGIIAGEYRDMLDDDGELLPFAGMAPRTKLHSFKVLDDRGQGDDSAILIALDKIASINEQSKGLRIHGINLSLGGNFDPSVFGCGHTPLCEELRRLWRQGVLIVLAAGNEGFAVLQTLEDGPWQVNLDLSVGDPANLEEAIAVGSVHRINPHTYGVSYFSSRGPTADGRRKPDLVAPGEKILSARADFKKLIGAKPRAKGKTVTTSQLYVAESGTSMAAPHVSGILAAFLSQRREFIGYPDRVKKILLDNCTDLGRDAYAQGAGLPNLVRMLAST